MWTQKRGKIEISIDIVYKTSVQKPKNDKFDYHPDDTIYQARREQINGTSN